MGKNKLCHLTGHFAQNKSYYIFSYCSEMVLHVYHIMSDAIPETGLWRNTLSSAKPFEYCLCSSLLNLFNTQSMPVLCVLWWHFWLRGVSLFAAFSVNGQGS